MPSKRVKLNVRPLRGDDEDSSEYVLIEGDQKTLEWLGNRLIEHAKGGRGCGCNFTPTGLETNISLGLHSPGFMAIHYRVPQPDRRFSGISRKKKTSQRSRTR